MKLLIILVTFSTVIANAESPGFFDPKSYDDVVANNEAGQKSKRQPPGYFDPKSYDDVPASNNEAGQKSKRQPPGYFDPKSYDEIPVARSEEELKILNPPDVSCTVTEGSASLTIEQKGFDSLLKLRYETQASDLVVGEFELSLLSVSAQSQTRLPHTSLGKANYLVTRDDQILKSLGLTSERQIAGIISKAKQKCGSIE